MRVLSDEIDRINLPADWGERESVLTIGSFDGIHIGHQQLIARLIAQARQQGRLSGLLTFYPHPVAVLRHQRAPSYLTTPGEKAAMLERFGLDWMAIVPFTEQLAAMSAACFVRHLYTRVNMRSLWIGADFALGRDRQGDLRALEQLGAQLGYQVCRIPAVSQEGARISSTTIRTLVHHGSVQAAAKLLGRFYSVSGEVVHGAQRGRCLGYPTANVDVRPDRVVPANGIYASFARLGEQRYDAVVYVGKRPSFDHGERSIEAHLLAYDGDLYGRDLVVEFVARLRGDQRFANPQDLVTQIERDIERARGILSRTDLPWAEKT